MAVTKGQTFKAEPLSSKTDNTLRPEQATSMNIGRTWFYPFGGKSSSKNTMHEALSTVRKWISPFGVVVVSTLIWLRALINASLCVLDEANRLQMDMRAYVVRSWRKISSSSLWISSLAVVVANVLSTSGGCGTLPLRVTIWTSLWAGPYPSEKIMKGVKGGTCCKYTSETAGCSGISFGANLNGLGTCCPWVYPLKSESSYKLINWGASPSYPIITTSPSMCSIKWIPPKGGSTTLVSWVGKGSVVTMGCPKLTKPWSIKSCIACLSVEQLSVSWPALWW